MQLWRGFKLIYKCWYGRNSINQNRVRGISIMMYWCNITGDNVLNTFWICFVYLFFSRLLCCHSQAKTLSIHLKSEHGGYGDNNLTSKIQGQAILWHRYMTINNLWINKDWTKKRRSTFSWSKTFKNFINKTETHWTLQQKSGHI